MTLVNSWRAGDEQRVFLQCDGCLPPEFVFGSLERVAAAGWTYEDIDRGPHRCVWCADRPPEAGLRRATAPEPDPGLPNLIVIGAAKCGTTSLHHYLSLHPEVHMSASKEVRLFHDPDCLDKLDTYATFFDRRSPVRGESSPRYSFHPLVPGVPERIRAAIPDAKLIYLVRDPIERTVSQYVDWRSQGWRAEDPTFARALGDLDDPYNEYIAAGRYASQLELFRREFPAERLLVVDRAELSGDREAALRRIFRFLEIDESFTSPGFADSMNRGAGKRAARPANPGHVRDRARRRVPRGVRRVVGAPLRRLRGGTEPAPAIDPELRARLRATFVDEVRRLQRLTGLEFRDWETLR